MGVRENLQKIIDRKAQEIEDLERSVRDAKLYLQGLQDAMKALPKENGSTEARTLRPGTEIAKARDILRNTKKPLHVTELLKQLGRPPDKGNRVSLSGSLAAYVRDGQIFTRPAPNTFGLVEFEEENQKQQTIPPSFGKV